MKLAVGTDHRGIEIKSLVIHWLKENNHEVIDVGANDEESCDYPDFALSAARLIHSGAVDKAVLICNTGIGMSIAANKVPGVYAAVCQSEFEAERCREHNDANCMCIPNATGKETLKKMLIQFTTTKSGDGRHARRVNKIKAIEDEFFS